MGKPSSQSTEAAKDGSNGKKRLDTGPVETPAKADRSNTHFLDDCILSMTGRILVILFSGGPVF